MTTTTAAMKNIDEVKLESDLGYRFGYLAEFIGFGPEDIETIHACATHLAPVVPDLVDAVYVKLFSYDATKRHFVPKQSGYAGLVPENMARLSLDHEMIRFRKQHLTNYLVKLVTASYDAKMVAFLDMVGKIHTPKAGSKELVVPLVQMDALMGFVSDAILGVLMGLNLENETRAKAVRAFNKLLWLQNDLIVRHYAAA